MRATIAIGIAAVTLAACSSTTSSSSSSAPGGTIALQPANSVRAAAATEGQPATIGTPATVDKLSVTLSDPVVAGDDSGPWLTTTVHVENATADDISVQFSIHCNGNPDAGGWQADSTYSNGDAIPASTFDDGTVNLLLPGDGRFGEPRPACATPATIVGETLGPLGRIVWPVPDELIAAINAAPQPA